MKHLPATAILASSVLLVNAASTNASPRANRSGRSATGHSSQTTPDRPAVANEPSPTPRREPAVENAILRSGFIFEAAPFPSAHASTIVETPGGLVAAWFGGTAERNPDVGIWVSRRDGRQWTAPVEVATGVQPDGTRLPCWNPVLFQPPSGPLILFYKVGPSPRAWWGMARTSADAGRTWS